MKVYVQPLTQCSGFKDPVLLQLWLRFNSLAQEFLYAVGMAMKKKMKLLV